jgi:8-oxo-dGTP pyrophosphatase MutT (NUDIX family)
VRRWRPHSATEIYEHALFRLEEQSLRADDGDERRAIVMHPTPWVNMIPLLDDGRVVLVRQWRFGTARASLEIPGGMVDPGEQDLAAARRELREETGYEAGRWEALGVVDANPAIMSNRCSTWLARDLEWVEEPQGDGDEEIVVELAHLDDIPGLVASGEISHSLVVAAFYLLSQKGPRS